MDYTGANCTTRMPDEFFPEKGSAQIQARDAKMVCLGKFPGMRVCPLLAPCLEAALERHERFGVWGGKSERERTRIIRTRRADAIMAARPESVARLKRSEWVKSGWPGRKQREQRFQACASAFLIPTRSMESTHHGRTREHSTHSDS